MVTIEEKNKMIAEFMGIKTLRYHEGIDDDRYYFYDLEFPFLEPDEMKYNTSWDWLMSAVKKCKNLLSNPKDVSDIYILRDLEETVFSCEINIAYDGVVKFINWYNKQK